MQIGLVNNGIFPLKVRLKEVVQHHLKITWNLKQPPLYFTPENYEIKNTFLF